MSLEMTSRDREGVVILDLEGRLIVGQSTAELRETVKNFVSQGQTRIILNLAKVDYIDSTGLGGLVIAFTTAQKAGGGLKLLNLNRRELELIVLTKLSTVFDIFTDEQDAINSFFPGREIKKFDILSFVQQQRDED